ncbi:predicted protein [Thalassiosira pseudonana CCMP1335]|uniref:SET domain-containing protein n=1 Tax=Thalassiosira pseudonana TaxID=35128 RepID=B8BS96_THAPS|nr:predicted protein [Thalassiosira pseudonana CCMP1335]EED96682.1 predicted protein [Thalassiosira pseudonana CCMP1335]
MRTPPLLRRLVTFIIVSFVVEWNAIKPAQAFTALPSSRRHHRVHHSLRTSSTDSDNMTMESLRDFILDKKSEFLSKLDNNDTIEATIHVQEQLLSTRLSDLHLDKTYVDTSTIPNAGRGLFAKRLIQKGEVITCYPGDAVLVATQSSDDDLDEDDDEDDEDGEDWVDESVMWGSHVDPIDRWEEDDVFDGTAEKEPLTHYACAVTDTYSVMGLPTLDGNPSYLGQFANDAGGYLALGEADLTQGIEKGIASYVIESVELSNAMHKEVEGMHMATVATKDIAKGNEIFVTYGPDFWMDFD